MSCCYCAPSSTSTVDQHGVTSISIVHSDIIRTHILTRLDGQTLASTGCVSSQLHSITNDDYLWRDICTSTWPSITDPSVTQLISTFRSGYRSFFSYAFPILDHHHFSNIPFNPNRSSPPSELISTVDFFYKDKLIFSNVQHTVTQTGSFLCSPFMVDFLDPKESITVPIRHVVGDNITWLKHLEENLTLSWIIIDPVQKRAVNLSSRNPVSVQRHWLSGDVQLRYGTVMARGGTREMVQCGVMVTLGGKKGGEMHVSGVCMQVEDMDGKYLNGKESLLILKSAIEMVKRKRWEGNEGKKRYEEYLEMKRKKQEREYKIEKFLDLACTATWVSVFLAFLCYVFLR